MDLPSTSGPCGFLILLLTGFLRLLPLILLQLLREFGGGPEFRGTCMSSGLRVQLESILQRVNRIAEELADVNEDLAALQEEGAFGDWVLVEEPRDPLPVPIIKPIWDLLSFQGAEGGPIELPRSLRDFALERIEGRADEALEKARQAFKAGFWCDIALSTHTHYSRLEEIAAEDRTHWIILYRRFPLCNRRVTDLKSFQTALEVEPNCVWEGFSTLAELTIFCVGARIRLPPLEKWTSLF